MRYSCFAAIVCSLPARVPGQNQYWWVSFDLYDIEAFTDGRPGNAKIQGMTAELDMEYENAHRYSELPLGAVGTQGMHWYLPTTIDIALFIFFVPYILFEVPSNLILKKLAPSTWLSLIMVLWGKDHLAFVSGYNWQC
jgi:hypothetical protein